MTRISPMVEIEFLADDPVEGWVRETSRLPPLRPTIEIRFSGWAGLLEAIATMRAAARLGRALEASPAQVGPRGDAQFPEDAAQMGRDRSLRDEQTLGDLHVGQSFANECDDASL